MTVNQSRTVTEPNTDQRGDDASVRLAILAAGMGLLATSAVPTTMPSSALIEAIAASALQAGVGVRAASRLRTPEELTPGERRRLIEQLEAELRASPVPAPELAVLATTYDLDWLAPIVGTTPTSLRRYAAGTRVAPDDIAARIHYLALVNTDLAGSYNDFGRRRWWQRARTPLGGASPIDYLETAFDPDGERAAMVASLAHELVGAGGAT